MPDTKYTSKVFVSYSRSDSQQVLPLVERLERETGVHLWIDRDGIESAEQFEDVIIRAIDQAEVVLFMLSDNSQHSHWTKDEVSYAKNIGKRVVPIVLNGSDLHGWFLFKFGRVNYIDALKEDQLERLVKDLRQWLKIGKEPAPTPKPTPVPTSEPKPALEPVPQPPSVPTPKPDSKPEPTPKPEPKPKPDPDPVPPLVGWKKYVALALLAVILVAAVVFVATRTGEGGPGDEVAVVDSVVDSVVVHEWVDLGLSVKWATCNVGASSPEGYGDYYAWGETSTKSSYDEENCATYEKEIGDIAGTSRDVARVKWGGSWRMPTEAEFKELLNKCTWTWTTRNGVSGYKVTGPNGNSIFLPAAGYREGTSLDNAGRWGDYWSSAPDEDDTQDANYLDFDGGGRYTDWYDRYYGHTVRPVICK